jgi:hypothetical protein
MHMAKKFFLISCFIFQLVKLAKKLKKEKVQIDIVNFGEEVGFEEFFKG